MENAGAFWIVAVHGNMDRGIPMSAITVDGAFGTQDQAEAWMRENNINGFALLVNVVK